MEEKLREFLQHYLSIHEAEAVASMLEDEDYTAKDAITYVNWCKKRYDAGLSTEFEEWLDDRIPRVLIGFCVTEFGCPVAGTLEFPRHHEKMDGSDFEWYYSLREIADQIMALRIGDTIPFKIRDDQSSVGHVTRLA